MLTGVVVIPAAVVLAIVVAWRAVRRGQPGFVIALRVLFVLYLGWVVAATLFPLPIKASIREIEAAGASGVSVQLVPLSSILDVLRYDTLFAQVWILGGNVLTLVPFGFLLPFSVPRKADGASFGWRPMVLAALLFPLGIELSQLAGSLLLGYSYRMTEVDDVLLNFLGILLGYGLFVALRRRVSQPLAR